MFNRLLSSSSADELIIMSDSRTEPHAAQQLWHLQTSITVVMFTNMHNSSISVIIKVHTTNHTHARTTGSHFSSKAGLPCCSCSLWVMVTILLCRMPFLCPNKGIIHHASFCPHALTHFQQMGHDSRDPHEKEKYFWESISPLKSTESVCCGACSKRDLSVLINGTICDVATKFFDHLLTLLLLQSKYQSGHHKSTILLLLLLLLLPKAIYFQDCR